MLSATAVAAESLDDQLEPCFEADDPFSWWNAARDGWWSSLAAAGVAEALAVSPLLRSMTNPVEPPPVT